MAKKEDKIYRLRLECGHWIELKSRPNPRKAWPDPQMCETCKKKKRPVEIHSPRVEVSHLTAPNAPKDYTRKLTRRKKK